MFALKVKTTLVRRQGHGVVEGQSRCLRVDADQGRIRKRAILSDGKGLLWMCCQCAAAPRIWIGQFTRRECPSRRVFSQDEEPGGSLVAAKDVVVAHHGFPMHTKAR